MSSDTLPPPPEKGIVVSSLSLSLSLSLCVCIYNECKTWSLFFINVNVNVRGAGGVWWGVRGFLGGSSNLS